jgi:hypothetical protein
MAAMAHSVSISKFLFTGGLLSARQKQLRCGRAPNKNPSGRKKIKLSKT